MKKLLIGLLAVVVVAGGMLGARFVGAMNDSFEFAQSQARIGRAYMDGMQDGDFQEAAGFAQELMSEPPPQWNWHSMSEFDGRPVPKRWHERGVIFVRYRPGWVSLGWHGGPHAHSDLRIERGDDGSLTFTAHYTDYEPERILRTNFKAQQGAAGSPRPRLMSDSEGSNKPQPESDGRPR